MSTALSCDGRGWYEGSGVGRCDGVRALLPRAGFVAFPLRRNLNGSNAGGGEAVGVSTGSCAGTVIAGRFFNAGALNSVLLDELVLGGVLFDDVGNESIALNE
jgi:hypothetical protein